MITDAIFEQALADDNWSLPKGLQIPDTLTPAEKLLLLLEVRSSNKVVITAVRGKFMASGDPKWLPLMNVQMFFKCVMSMAKLPTTCPDDMFDVRTGAGRFTDLWRVVQVNRSPSASLQHVFEHWCKTDTDRRKMLSAVTLDHFEVFAALEDAVFRECVRLIALPPDGVHIHFYGEEQAYHELFAQRGIVNLCPFALGITPDVMLMPAFSELLKRSCLCGHHLPVEAGLRLSWLLYKGLGDPNAIEALVERVGEPVRLFYGSNSVCDAQMLIRFGKFVQTGSMERLLRRMGRHSMMPFLRSLCDEEVIKLHRAADNQSIDFTPFYWELRRRGKLPKRMERTGLFRRHQFEYLKLHCGQSFVEHAIELIAYCIRVGEVYRLDNRPSQLLLAALAKTGRSVEELDALPFPRNMASVPHLVELMRYGLLKKSQAHAVKEARNRLKAEHDATHTCVALQLGDDLAWLVRDFLGGMPRKTKRLTKKRQKEMERAQKRAAAAAAIDEPAAKRPRE